MGIGLAILAQVVGSFLFAGGAALQHQGVGGVVGAGGSQPVGLPLKGMLLLVTNPRWLLGFGCVTGGAALNLLALTMAPLAVVQPVGVLAVPWSVMLDSRLSRTPITGRMWGAVSLTILGVVAFTIASATSASDVNEFHFPVIVAAFAVVCVAAAVLTVAAMRARSWARPVLWASVGALFYGMATGMMKSAINLVRDHHRELLDYRVLVVIGFLAASYVLGVWMINRGYASGPASVTVGTMTTVDPVVAVAFGLFVLGEAARIGSAEAAWMVGSGAVAILGVVLLSRDHPDVRRRAAA